jgi:hypothetical protein
MMKNIIDLIKEKIRNHKKLSIIALLLFLLIGGTVGYVLLTNNETNNNPKVTQTNNQNKNPDTNVTGSNNAKKKEDKKSDDKKQDDKKSDEKKTDVKPEATATPSNDASVEETKNTTSNTVSNNTSTTTNNTTSNSTSNNNTPAPCVPTYTTVTHPEVGHYEQREIMPAYDKGIYAEKIVGLRTGRVYNSLAEFDAQDEDGNYTVTQVQVGTEHVEAVYDQIWVVDQQAWTETVASGC